MKLSQAILLGGLALGGAAGCEFDQIVKTRCPEIRFKCDGSDTRDCSAAIDRCASKSSKEDMRRDIEYGNTKDLSLLIIIMSSIMAIRATLRLHKDD